MLRTFGCRIVLLMSLLVSCVVQSGLAADSGSRWLVSPELLKHANLKILWENELPIKSTDSLGQLLILGNRLYAISGRNHTISLKTENGDIVFSRTVAPAGVPIVGLKLYGDSLMYAGGSELVTLDPASGIEDKTVDVGFGIVCPAARNNSYLYVSGDDNRLHVLRLKDRVHMFEVAAENNSVITSIVADDDVVVFGTDGGNVIGMAAGSPTRLWQFDAADAIAGPVVLDRTLVCRVELGLRSTLDSGIITEGLREKFEESGRSLSQAASVSVQIPGSEWLVTDNLKRYYVKEKGSGLNIYEGASLFFASRDTNVYRVNMVGLPDRKQLVWKHQTDGVLEKEPRVTPEVVYQYIRGKGVTAIDKQTGLFMWSVPGGLDLLAEANRRAYVITKDRKLVVMDNVKARRLYSVNFAAVSRHAANIADSKIYIADERGRIACLQPIE